ncbi:5'-methylthioadenosine nucleosidase / S-adenosylhomocysteine nucleosidase [hydrothermal vent metagenome]|uniref:5'-methylthioadenosine nucleosidase / S-adenosylhomocysteine nucleosidase n=1 Tax=hydrothermal vent metagenome TaxID=652676 RepID=A0A1W1DA76_9ZZZZ
MTKVGIVCAMREEVDKIIATYKLTKIDNHLGYKVYQNNHITLIESNIGKVASTLAATTLINRFNIDRLINIGLAGAINSIPTGSAHFISSVTQHDTFIPFDDYQQDMYQRIDCHVPKHADKAMILTTGDQFITNAVSINNGADMVDMEGFAIAYVANRYDIPITLIKGISDDANHNSKAELFQNLEMSMDQTIALLKTILD